ncbi:MAG: hypothetical protein JO163_15215 [Methylobacteriaceae bacterium]|nr:hypothetical protein [Methylobacteriaceae bacterium]MBV9217887.1 hypothetical protein [Methylobacteriaceae bacterium]MBV9704078.1 hypothetical protein [Methylobacteriaceae bacterium]
MKSLLLGAMLGLASLVSFAPASQAATDANACQSVDFIKGQADAGSARHGGRAIRLDGVEAAGFLDYLNNRIGDPTDYKGDTLIIGFYPDLGYVLVGFVLNGCADQGTLVKLDPTSFMKAYEAARGTTV